MGSDSDSEIGSDPAEDIVVPEGYVRVPLGLGFADRLQPMFRRRQGTDVSFGFRVDEQHLNLMGICHGGALMTLADISAATSIHAQREIPAPSPTINLSFDFMSPGRLGRWLHTEADHVQVKRNFGFCSGVVLDEDVPVLRYSGTFYFAKPRQDESGTKANARFGSLLGGDNAPD